MIPPQEYRLKASQDAQHQTTQLSPNHRSRLHLPQTPLRTPKLTPQRLLRLRGDRPPRYCGIGGRRSKSLQEQLTLVVAEAVTKMAHLIKTLAFPLRRTTYPASSPICSRAPVNQVHSSSVSHDAAVLHATRPAASRTTRAPSHNPCRGTVSYTHLTLPPKRIV